jgi:xanthine dehydrogenase accessory factor
MRGLAKVLTISLLAAALGVACKNDVRRSPKPELAAATPATTTVAKTTEAPGMCGAAAEDNGESCGCHQGNTNAGEPGEKPVVPMSEAKVGDRTTCPVMNTVFVVLPDSPKLEVGGKTYYFCCDGCANKFKEDPKRFIDS